jgi:hypothetical protein
MTASTKRSENSRITIRRKNVDALESILAWYFHHYFGTEDGPGSLPFYCDPSRVGAFAVNPAELSAGNGEAVFKVASALTMFQTRRDVDIMSAQAAMTKAEVSLLSTQVELLAALATTQCPHAADLLTFKANCSVYKTATREVDCETRPGNSCVVKESTRLMRRYGDFGKVPVALAWVAQHHGVPTFGDLYSQALVRYGSPAERATWLEQVLCDGWRINKKISNFILSALTNPDLTPGLHPWAEGVQWTHFVVIDRHVARALADLGAPDVGSPSSTNYEVLREWLFAYAKRVDLQQFHPGIHSYNPRLVQQALYRFRSSANRLAAPYDCCHLGADTCRTCPSRLRSSCPCYKP